jgi:hypothetical protein
MMIVRARRDGLTGPGLAIAHHGIHQRLNMFREEEWAGRLHQHKDIWAPLSGKKLAGNVGHRCIIRC